MPDFAFQVAEARPDNSYITNNTSILVIAPESKVNLLKTQRDICFDDVIGQEKAKSKTKIIFIFKSCISLNVYFLDG